MNDEIEKKLEKKIQLIKNAISDHFCPYYPTCNGKPPENDEFAPCLEFGDPCWVWQYLKDILEIDLKYL